LRLFSPAFRSAGRREDRSAKAISREPSRPLIKCSWMISHRAHPRRAKNEITIRLQDTTTATDLECQTQGILRFGAIAPRLGAGLTFQFLQLRLRNSPPLQAPVSLGRTLSLVWSRRTKNMPCPTCLKAPKRCFCPLLFKSFRHQ